MASGDVAKVRELMAVVRESGAALAPELEAAATKFLAEAAKKEALAAAAALAAERALVSWAKARSLLRPTFPKTHFGKLARRIDA